MAKLLTASQAQMLVIESHEATSKATREYHRRLVKPTMAQRWMEFYSFLKMRRESALQQTLQHENT